MLRTWTLIVCCCCTVQAIAQSGSVSIGSALGEPGETVAVDITASFDTELIGFAVFFQYDRSILELTGFDLRDSAFAGHNPVNALFGVYDEDGALGLVGYSPTRSDERHRLVHPGEGILVGRAMFRVLASASHGRTGIELVEGSRRTQTSFQFDVGGVEETVLPELNGSGSVDVLGVSGPRPVGYLTCVQDLDRIVLEYELTQDFDELIVRRDGREVALFDGSVRRVELEQGELGVTSFSVVGRVGDAESRAAECELQVRSARAPGVENLRCDAGLLQWTLPRGFDAIYVHRDGGLLAVLPGDAESYMPVDESDGSAVYEVVSFVGGFESEPAVCIANGEWAFELPDVLVRSDVSELEVPVLATMPLPVACVGMHLDVSGAPLEFVRDIDPSLARTLSDVEPELVALGIGVEGVPSVGIIYDLMPPRQEYKVLHPGVRQLVFRFRFTVQGPLVEGDVFPLQLVGRSSFCSEVNGFSEDFRPTFLVPGEIRVLDSTAQAEAIIGLAGSPIGDGGVAVNGAPPGVRLRWRTTRQLDSIRVERNGALLTELPGDATEYQDRSTGAGHFTYRLVGLVNGVTTYPARTYVTTLSSDHFFLRGDTDRDHRVTLSDPIRTLGYLFLRGESLSCEDAADADDDGSLTLSDAVLTLRHLFLAGPPLPSPGSRVPWYDPTPDELGCGI